MEIKYTVQGLLIYQTISFYALALLMNTISAKHAGFFMYALGFITATAAVIYRGIHAGHFPLSNLFEVFLFLGAAIFPLTLVSRKIINSKTFTCDVVIGIIVLFPAGYIFSAEQVHLPPALQSVFFVPHVLAYMLAYIILAKAAIVSSGNFTGTGSADTDSYRLVCVGFIFLTAGLLLGSIWAKFAWGRCWGWDPKELWSLASWTVFGGYFHFRSFWPGRKKTNSLWLLTGLVFIVITLVWVNLSRIFAGLHSYS